MFEDCWQGYVFSPAKALLDNGADVAAMTLLTSYFEAIASYMKGENSDGKSRQFFIYGFSRCFDSRAEGIEIVAKEIYRNIRCGLAHTGMLTPRVNFSRSGGHPFIITYPRNPDGSLDLTASSATIVIKPKLIYDGVLHHFDQYIKTLRDTSRPDLADAFK